MAHDPPELGVYFTSNDPATLRPQDGKPVFNGRLDKFNTIQWMIKVFQSDNYSIYRLVLPPSKINYQLRPPVSKRKVLQGEFLVTP